MMEIEQVKGAQTPEQMRAELFRLSRYNNLVRSVFDAANYNGASAEDKYTMLAYYAVKTLCRLEQENVTFLMNGKFPLFFKDTP